MEWPAPSHPIKGWRGFGYGRVRQMILSLVWCAGNIRPREVDRIRLTALLKPHKKDGNEFFLRLHRDGPG